MINHPFVPSDENDDYCERCDKHSDLHANIEGITDEDELFDFGESLTDIAGRYSFREDW